MRFIVVAQNDRICAVNISFMRFLIRKEREMKKSLFGKVVFGLVGVLILGAFSFAAIGGQNLNISLGVKNTSGAAVLATGDALGDTIVGRGTATYLAVSGVPQLVKAGIGRIAKVNVISASGVVTFYDVATAASAASANKIAIVPATVGTVELDFPVTTGIVIDPSSSVVSFSYQ